MPWTNKDFYFSCNKNSTRRHFRTQRLYTVPLDFYLFTQQSFACLHDYCFMAQDGSIITIICRPGRKKGESKGKNVYWLFIWSTYLIFFYKKTIVFFLDSSPDDFHLYLIGQSEVTWLLLSLTSESGKCSILGKVDCHSKETWSPLCRLSSASLMFSYMGKQYQYIMEIRWMSHCRNNRIGPIFIPVLP